MAKKNNENGLFKQQEEQIIQHSETFINLLVQRGILGDDRIDDEKKRAAQKEKRKNTYHNTLMLLKNYRTIAWVMECFPASIAEELDRPFGDVDELLDGLDVELSLENRKLESRITGLQKSRVLLDRVNDALTVLKCKPNDGEKLYDLIYQTYITPEKLGLTDILYRLDMSPRHYYRLREQAITILSIRLWSVPAKEMDLWFEMLTLLEDLD